MDVMVHAKLHKPDRMENRAKQLDDLAAAE